MMGVINAPHSKWVNKNNSTPKEVNLYFVFFLKFCEKNLSYMETIYTFHKSLTYLLFRKKVTTDSQINLDFGSDFLSI